MKWLSVRRGSLHGSLGKFLALGLIALHGPISGRAEEAAPAVSLKTNGNFEAAAEGWPSGWGRPTEGGSWQEENGNHFIRLQSPSPGAMVMLYQEIPIPKGVEGLEIKWKQRISGLAVGAQPWFDARILMEFLDSSRAKLPAHLPTPYFRKDTDGWQEEKVDLLVPPGAAVLKLMPSLFQVKAGALDLDDLAITPIDPAPLRAAEEAAAAEKAQKLADKAAVIRIRADATLKANNSLVTNGAFETDAKGKGWPDDWGHLKAGGSWIDEGGNHFLRLATDQPGNQIMAYRTIDLPTGAQALEMTWRQRVTGLKVGDAPWFDARIMMQFLGADGKKLSPSPPAAYTQKDTDGWVERKIGFLVPSDATTLVLMPTLFKTRAGTFDLDNIVIKPADPAPLIAAAKQREEEIKASYVPPEQPQKDHWPKPLHVEGNHLADSDGKFVWLQGVNTPNLETLPHDKQVLKSVVVAIEDWKANCVRVPVKEEFWYGQNSTQKDGGQEYRQTIDAVITLAANRGAYVVIDLHRFRAPKPEHARFWKDFATIYKNHPAVLFDLFNEPHGISWAVWQKGGFVGDKEGVDESAFLSDEEKKKNQGFESVGMQALIDAVRSAGAKNIVIVGGLGWSNDLSGVLNGFALDDKGGHGIMYSWHTYNWHKGWDRILPVAEKYPIFLGEVGADIKKMGFIPASQQEDPYTFIPDMLGFIQKYKINWTAWSMHPRATPVLISDWKYTPTPFWGVFAQEALAGKRFEMKKIR